MKIICPNLKNEEVAKEFEELKNATSEAAAYHIWSQNNGNGIDKAPNGEPSKLFSDLLEHYNGDRVAAIQAKARTYSKSFKEWFGESKVVDENGEPLIVYSGRPTKGSTTFNLESKRSRTHLTGLIKKGVYFTKDKQIAEMYSGSRDYASQLDRDMAKYRFGEDGGALSVTKEEFLEIFPDVTSQYYDEMMEKYNRVVNDPDNFTGEFFASKIDIEGEVIPAFLNLRNTTTVDMQGSTIAHLSKEQKESINNSEGAIIENVDENASGIALTSGITTTYVAFNPNQIKSIDNQGTFSTHDNNIYHQEVTTVETPTGRNTKLQAILQKVYPQINLSEFSDPNLRGQAIVRGNKAGEVLINAALENQDTLPHEYAHHYIAWFRNTSIVQRAIKAFGTEEKLVQAIGENAVKAVSWYKKIWNSIKGLFNKKQAELNQLTQDFLEGKQYMNPVDVLEEEIHHQELDPNVKSTVKAIDEVYEKLISDIQTRIRDLSHYKVRDNKKIDELNNLITNLSNMENDRAVFQFIEYMAPDIQRATERINRMLNSVKKSIETNTPIVIDVEQLIQLKKGFIGFYSTEIDNIQNMLDDYTVGNYINDPVKVNELAIALKTIKDNNTEIIRKYKLIASEVTKQILYDHAKAAGSFTAEDVKKKINVTDQDLSWFETYLGSPIYARDEAIRIMADKILNAKNMIANATLVKGRKITNIAKDVNKKDILLIQEKNKKGETTGYMTRDLNYGQHEQELLEFKRNLADKYNLVDIYSRPEDLSTRRKYNRELNRWYASHSERRFIPEFYSLFDDLSDEAVNARDKYQDEINYLLAPTVDKEGNPHKELLSDEDWDRLQRAEKAKQNLANPFNNDGTLKDGVAKQIAEEITTLNKKLQTNLEYKPNMEKFLSSYAKAKKLSKELFKKWLDRNTVIKIDQQFWEDLDKVTNSYEKSEKTLSLEEQRKQLIKLYRDEAGDINRDDMPDNVKRQIAELDKEIQESRSTDRSASDAIAGGGFNTMAYLEVDPKYYVEYEKAATMGDEAFQKWLNENTYNTGQGLQPASFWTRIRPIDKKYLTRYPNKSWLEIDRESYYYNKNFDESAGVPVIPKRSLYDNTAAYRKITSNPKLKKLYDEIVELKKEADANIAFMQYSNPYKLAQIEGGAWTIIQSQDTLLKGLKHLFVDKLTIRESDDRYVKESMKRSDGSPVNLVPTRYMRMLDNPAEITRDVVGSMIKYYEMSVNYKVMSDVAPELEIITEQLEERKFSDPKKGVIKGEATKVTKKAKKMMDMHVWGKMREDLEVSLFGKTFKVGKLADMLMTWTRLTGISQNINVILTGLITNKLQNRLEALSGYYFDNSDLMKASLEVQASYASALMGLGQTTAKNKIVGLMEYAQIGRSNAETFAHLNQSRVIRTLNQHYWYFGHEMVDYATKGKMLVACYMAYKFNPAVGKFQSKNEFMRNATDKKKAKKEWNRLTTSLYDAYEMKDNLLVLKDEYKNIVDTQLENKVKNTARTIGTRIDGQLSDIDKSFIHANTLAQFLTLFRNFMIVNAQTMFTTKGHFNYSTGRFVRSYYGAAGQYAKDNVLPYIYNILDKKYNKRNIDQLGELANHIEEMQEFEKAAFKRTAYGFVFAFLVLGFATMILNGMADDDKDNWWKNELAYLSARSKLESKSNYWPGEWFQLLNSPTAATNTLTGIYDMFMVWFDKPFADIRKGPYRGMKRYQRSLIKMTPLKFYYEAQDPRSKREYLEHQLLN